MLNKSNENQNGRRRMGETYIKVNGLDRYLSRALDRKWQTIDFLLTAHRDQNGARRFLGKATKNSIHWQHNKI
ncbi:MAG: DDE-type integrase/transposase/recombinase [Bdellovibrionaceae bacterium]|nr:DDE-type integrase/transposase/recombinase [Pseudobdellovibrionaceae bacterium]